LFRTTAGPPPTLAEFLGGIPHSPQANTGIVPRIGNEGFLPNPFPILQSLNCSTLCGRRY